MKKLLLALIVLSLMITACQTSQNNYRQVRSVNNGENPSTVEPSSTEPTPSTLSPIKEQLQYYLQNPPSTRITYTLQNSIQDQDGIHTVTGTQIVALRGKDLKLQTQTEAEGQSFSTISYVVNGHYYACQMEKEWTCYEFPQPDQDLAPQIQQSIREDLDQLDIQDGGQRTILGKNTRCFKLLFNDPQSQDQGETIYCYDSEGALLYSQTKTPDFESNLEATAYEDVSDSDFQLPAPAQPIEEPAEN